VPRSSDSLPRRRWGRQQFANLGYELVIGAHIGTALLRMLVMLLPLATRRRRPCPSIPGARALASQNSINGVCKQLDFRRNGKAVSAHRDRDPGRASAFAKAIATLPQQGRLNIARVRFTIGSTS
jgi:hypothetical protein